MSETLTEPLYIGIAPVHPGGQVTLRADLGDAAVAAALRDATGLEMPSALCVAASGDDRAVWMSPDELLLMVADAPGTVAALQDALAGQHHMALDVSDTRAVFRLTGAAVGEVLAKGAPCDLSDHGCPPGTARRTHLAGLAVGIWRVEAEVWEVVCFRSYAHHLDAWLRTVAVQGSEIG